MRTFSRIVTGALVASVALAAAPARAGLIDNMIAKKKEGGAFDLTKDPASQIEEYVKTKNLEALKGLKKVAIPWFQVEFAVENKTSAVGGGARVKANARLYGVDQSALPAIADAFHDRLLADLEAAGIEVVPYETVKANEHYQKMKGKFHDSPHMIRTQDGYSLVYGPHGMPVYFRGNDERLGGATVFGEAFSTIQPQNIEPGIGKDLGAAVLRVRVSVDIAKQYASGSMMGGSASAETKAQLGLMADWTMMEFIRPGEGTARVWLGRYVNAEEPILELVKDKKGSSYLDLSALGGGPTSDVKYAIVTTTEDYTRVVHLHLDALRAMFFAAIRPAL